MRAGAFVVSPSRAGTLAAHLTYTDLIDRPPKSTRGPQKVTPRLYCTVVVGTGVLAVAQFYFLPNNLGLAEFGYVVLGLSVVQAGLQLSDLGMVNASLRSDLAGEVRVALRVNAVAVASLICVAGIVACAGLALGGHSSALVAAAALVCALWLIGDRAHASAAVQSGDEKMTTRYNVVWQNSPKIGTIVGSFANSAFISMLGAVVTSLILSRPQLPPRPDWTFLRNSHHLWLPGLAVSVSAFLLTWTETYLLSAISGVDEAGQYQAVVRPLTGITYLYLPLVALIQAAHNAAAGRRVRLLTGFALGAGTFGSAAVAVFLVAAGRKIWPDFSFDLAVIIPAAIASTAMCASTVVGTQLVLRGNHLVASVNSALGAVVLLVTAVVTVESMGAAGAALASACAWSFVALCHVGFLLVVRYRRKGDPT